MGAYPHRCPKCKSPSRNTNGSIICSNVKCKTWKQRRKQAAMVERVNIEVGVSSDNPVIIHCPTCNNASVTARRFLAIAATLAAVAYCYSCQKWFDYTYEIGKWYLSDAPHWKETLTYHYIGAPKYWEWNTKIMKCKQGEQQ